MNLAPHDMAVLTAALFAVLMVGSRNLRANITMFALQTFFLSLATLMYGIERRDDHLYALSLALFVFKTVGVPSFLNYVITKVAVQKDSGIIVPTPVAMHLSIAFMGLSYWLAKQLPVPPTGGLGWPGAAAAISLVCSGLILMLTRRVALSQIVGFLVVENGIYCFGLTQTHGMPLIVEMGILLDVLMGVMVAGLLAFRIKKSFEHIDVTMLAELKE